MFIVEEMAWELREMMGAEMQGMEGGREGERLGNVGETRVSY